MISPSWLLLLWCGLAATFVAGGAASVIGGTSAAPWSLAPVPRNRAHGLQWSIAAGMFLYPVVYGIAFEALHRADLRTGLVLGSLHGAMMFIAARRHVPTHAALRVGLAHLVYAATIGFLYVTP